MPASSSATDAPGWLIFAIIGGFIVSFPLLWCFIVWMLSEVGGWRSLARRYSAGCRPVIGESHGRVSGRVGWVNYNRVLTLHFTPEGFFLEVMPIFRISHPRLFIPWSAITERSPMQIFWWKVERLSIGAPVITTITLPAKLVAQHWPER